MKIENLTLVGTSHIAKQSIQEVENAVEEKKPDILAIELDKKRYYALLHEKKRKLKLSDIRKIGIKGFLFNVIGAWVEKKLGKVVGVEPGAEMIHAINLAKKKNIKIALIDQDIEVTLKKISIKLGWKERFNLVIDFFKGLVFRKSQMKKLGIEKDLDLSKVPPKKLIKKLTKIMEKRYPGLFRVLVEERNYVMAANLRDIMTENPEKKIVAVVGAGHVEEIENLLKQEPEPEITYSYSNR